MESNKNKGNEEYQYSSYKTNLNNTDMKGEYDNVNNNNTFNQPLFLLTQHGPIEISPDEILFKFNYLIFFTILNFCIVGMKEDIAWII